MTGIHQLLFSNTLSKFKIHTDVLLSDQGYYIDWSSIDFALFTREFKNYFYEISWSEPNSKKLEEWKSKPPRNGAHATIETQFCHYMGQYTDETGTKFCLDYMMEKFNERYEQFGLVVLDEKRTFDDDDIYTRWENNDRKCEGLGIEIDWEDVRGDHAIPHSWGVFKGGKTILSNLRVVHDKFNSTKGAREWNEFMASEDLVNLKKKLDIV